VTTIGSAFCGFSDNKPCNILDSFLSKICSVSLLQEGSSESWKSKKKVFNATCKYLMLHEKSEEKEHDFSRIENHQYFFSF
jgi:hypothetical protein